MTSLNNLLAGAGKVNITPLGNTSLSGYVLRNGLSKGVLHQIFARALFLQQGKEKVLIINCEVLGFSKAYVAKIRSALHKSTNIPLNNIMVACTHTHSGPATIFLREAGDLDQDYLDYLIDPIVKAAKLACQNTASVNLSISSDNLFDVSENRRAEGGPIDPELIVVNLAQANGKHLATLLNFACHPTSLQHTNMLISGGYPGYVMQTLEKHTDGIIMFFNGATGNIRPIRRNSEEAMQTTGDLLVSATLDCLINLIPIHPVALTCLTESIEIGFQTYLTEEALMKRGFKEDGSMFYMPERTPFLIEKQRRIVEGWRENMLSQFENGLINNKRSFELQVVKLGPIALLGVGGELFVELGLSLKERADLKHLIISCYTNDNVGYIPTKESFTFGGYELEESFFLYNNPGMLLPSTGDQIVEKAIQMINNQ